MGEIDAVGDAVTGGLIGRAVEPPDGEDLGHTHETECLNCGALLGGPYCHRCGQHAHVHRTLGAFWHDLLHGVFHFEGKIWRTLPMLAWKPGELTRRYIEGQRASFISPIALFLFSVFLMFAVMSVSGAHFGGVPNATKQELADQIRQQQRQIKELQAERARQANDKAAAAALDEEIADTKAAVATIEAIHDGTAPPEEALNISEDAGVPEFVRDMVGKVGKNPELLFYKLKANAYKFSWALIPISVPFVWLLFPFSRRFRLYDHTVFVTYSISFMTLLLIVATIVGMIWSAPASLAWFIPPIHMYRQLRGTYGVGVFGAIWRALALTLFAFIAISLFVSLLVGIGAVG